MCSSLSLIVVLDVGGVAYSKILFCISVSVRFFLMYGSSSLWEAYCSVGKGGVDGVGDGVSIFGFGASLFGWGDSVFVWETAVGGLL